MRLALVSALAVAVALLAASPAGAHTGDVKNCGDGKGTLSNNIWDIRAHGISCREARRVVRNLACADDECTRLESTGKLGTYKCSSRNLGYEHSKQRCRRGDRYASWHSGA